MPQQQLPDFDRVIVRNNRLAIGLALIVLGVYASFIFMHYK